MRNRLFAQHTDVKPVLLSMDDSPTYPQIRETLLEQGQLVEGMQLLNVFEWFRNHDIDDRSTTGDELPEVKGLDQLPILHPDGTLYQTQHVKRHGSELVMTDYHRADGSIYLRVPAGRPNPDFPVTSVFLVNSKGEPVGRWPSQRGWRKNWIISLLEPDRRAFLFCDSRFAIADILPLNDQRLHIMHVIHNVHVRSPYLWSSPLSSTYRPLFNSIRHLDGLITLTARQGTDVAQRMGATDNLFVVPNPVETSQAPPSPPARAQKHFVMVARLEIQKRIEDAIRAFALVLKEEPEATLDIFGDGSLYTLLSQEITALGVQDSVRLRGHHPDPSHALRTATAMLLTSRFEGYPLATLESLGQGCPVISYDMKYGPREQLTPGVDGFLVEQGDLHGLADHVVRLIRDPELAARLSEGALEKAKQHSAPVLLNNWRQVLETVIDRKPRRTTIKSVALEVSRLGYRRPHRLPDELAKGPLLHRLSGRRSGSAGFRTAPPVEFAGRLKLVAKNTTASLDEIVFSLDAVDQTSGTVVPLPLAVKRSGQSFRLSSSFDPADIFTSATTDPAGPAVNGLQLRLRLVWHNSSWETMLARPQRLAPNYELSYAANGQLALLRGPAARKEPPAP